MKTKIKLLRGQVFATVYLYLAPFNPIGAMFIYQGETYKIIDAVFIASDKPVNHDDEEVIPVFTVVQVPTI